MGTELKGKTLGIVGFGNIGQRVAEMASVIGMKIITNSSSASDEDLSNLNASKVSTEQLLTDSDILTLHTKLNDNTKNMLNLPIVIQQLTTIVFRHTEKPTLFRQFNGNSYFQHPRKNGSRFSR